MRRVGLIAILGLFLSGCSYTDIVALVNPSSTPLPPTSTATLYLTPTNTATITPTQPTPTYTLTPTLVYPNGTPTSSMTASPLPTLLLPFAETGTPAPEPLVGTGPFSSILIPGKQLFWGSCDQTTLNVTVKLASGVKAVGVVMAIRLQDTASGERTGWGQAIMDKQGGGVFSYVLTAKAFTHYREFKRAWGQYQFIAYTSGLVHVGSSQVYLNNLTIAPCP